MSTTPLHVASNTSEVLKALAGKMNVQHLLGQKADAGAGSPVRIVWVPDKDGESYAPKVRDAAGGKTIMEATERYLVHIWAPSVERAQALRGELFAALYQALGSDNFEATRGGFDDEPVQQNSVVLAITVTLKHIPIFSEIRQAVTLTGATATGTVTDPEGNAPADAGTITVTL